MSQGGGVPCPAPCLPPLLPPFPRFPPTETVGTTLTSKLLPSYDIGDAAPLLAVLCGPETAAPTPPGPLVPFSLSNPVAAGPGPAARVTPMQALPPEGAAVDGDGRTGPHMVTWLGGGEGCWDAGDRRSPYSREGARELRGLPLVLRPPTPARTPLPNSWVWTGPVPLSTPGPGTPHFHLLGMCCPHSPPSAKPVSQCLQLPA